MKSIILTSILLLFMSCNSTKDMQVQVKKNYFSKTVSQENNTKISEKWQVVPNASINFEKDKFGIGMVKLAKGNKTVIYYKYESRPVDKSMMDGGYVQDVFFEFEGDIKNISLKDKQLSQINLLVGKHGFFRGSGVYAVTSGSFDLEVTGQDQIEIDVNIAKPNEMVQKTHLHTTIELNQTDDE